ncbi:MAG: hypothetical protein JXA96_01610 [Sedimentisphaerales bacterium]|nr:hypothetical protein [Sedimentisphaerales bacterium]
MDIEVENDNKNKAKSRKYKLINILLFLLFIGIFAFAFYRINSNRTLSSRLEASRAAGYPVTFEELNQWYLMPLDEQNSATYILNALQYYNLPNDEKLLPVIGKAELPSRTESMNEETKEIISQYLDSNQKCLELLHKTVGLEHGRYLADYRLGQGVPLPPLNQIQKYTILLQLEAVYAAENNNPDIAFKSIKSIFGVAGSLNKEPTFGSQSNRNAFQRKAISVLEYVINKTSLSDEQLIELINDCEKAELVRGILNAILGQRIMTMDMIMHPKSSYFDPVKDPVLFAFPPILSIYKAIGINDSDAIILLKITDDVIKAYNLPAHQRIEASKALDSEINSILSKHVLLRRFAPSFGRMIILDLRNIAELRITQTALAIERYRLANNKLPESLEEIVPDYLDSIPLDPYDGKEIRYKKLDRGFVVYSIGEDQIDDGGKEYPRDKSDSTYDITFIIEK